MFHVFFWLNPGEFWSMIAIIIILFLSFHPLFCLIYYWEYMIHLPLSSVNSPPPSSKPSAVVALYNSLLVVSVLKPPSDSFTIMIIRPRWAITTSPALSLRHSDVDHLAKLTRVPLFHSISFALQFPLFVVYSWYIFICNVFVQSQLSQHRKHPSLPRHPVARLEHLHSVSWCIFVQNSLI